MIRFEGVTVRYPGQRTTAVRSFSLSVRPGEVTAVVGPNGSGKSTVVRTLLGRVDLESGSVTVDEVSLAALSRRDVARRMAVVTQREEPVFPMLVRDFIALGRFAHGSLWAGPTSGDVGIVESSAERAGVAAFLDRRTDALSGGEWQRVRIARALAQQAPSLVLDEPTTFLDVAHEMSVFELLDELAHDGVAVLLVSHQLNLVARFADRIALLHAGEVVAVGSPSEVMRGELLERVYEWPLVVSRDPAVGAPMLVPLRGRVAR